MNPEMTMNSTMNLDEIVIENCQVSKEDFIESFNAFSEKTPKFITLKHGENPIRANIFGLMIGDEIGKILIAYATVQFPYSSQIQNQTFWAKIILEIATQTVIIEELRLRP